MTKPLGPGWTAAFGRAGHADESTWTQLLGIEPRRCFRVSQAHIEGARNRGRARSNREQRVLRSLPPLDDDEA